VQTLCFQIYDQEQIFLINNAKELLQSAPTDVAMRKQVELQVFNQLKNFKEHMKQMFALVLDDV